MIKKLSGIIVAMAISTNALASPEKTKVTVAVGGQSIVAYVPLTIADKLGFFKEEGLDVKIADVTGGGAKAMQTIVGGSADIAIGALENVVRVNAKGAPVKAFLIQNFTPGIVIGVLPGKVPNFTSMKDLEGKRIGITSPGSSTQLMASYAITRAGGDPSKTAFFGFPQQSAAYAAASRGMVDGLSYADPTMTMLEREGKMKIVVDLRDVAQTKKALGGVMPTGAAIATSKFIEENPQTVQAFTNAMVKSLKWMSNASGSEVAKVVPSHFYQDLAVYIAVINANKASFSKDGIIPVEGINTAARLLETEKDFNRTRVNLNDTFTNQFVRKANLK